MSSAVKFSLALLQLTGLALSITLVALTYLNPKHVEEKLQEIVVTEVLSAAETAWTASGAKGQGSKTERLNALSDRLDTAALALDSKREQIVNSILAQSLSKNCSLNCEFWTAASHFINDAMILRISQIRLGQATLQEFIMERYEKSLNGLLWDLRRFGLVNAVVLALMLGLLLLRDHLNWRFWVFSVAVTGYVAWAAYGYMFNQNWAHSILFQNWSASAYQFGMMFVACLFFDWLFLRGKITHIISDVVASILPG